MCPIHVLAFMSQHLCISGSSARSMSPDPCLNIHIYLRSFCKIHVSDSCLIASLSSDFVALRRRNANFDLRRRVLCGPAQGKQSGRDPRERFAQAKRKFWAPETRFIVWPCAGKTVRPSVSRRRNANFELPRCIFCGPAQAKRKFWPPETHLLSRWSGFTRSHNRRKKPPRRYSETQKKIPARSFAQAKRKFWPPESRFLWPCAVKNEGDKKKHLDLRGFTLTVRTPQCDTLFGEKNWGCDAHDHLRCLCLRRFFLLILLGLWVDQMRKMFWWGDRDWDDMQYATRSTDAGS